MKKAMILILSIVFTLSLAMPAFAAKSPTGIDELPLLIDATSKDYELISWQDMDKLSEEEKQAFLDSKKSLKDACPEGMTVRYHFFLKTSETCDAHFNIQGEEFPVVKQYIDGKWVQMDYVVNEDGTITVLNAENAPMAIFFMVDGAKLTGKDGKPLLISMTAEDYELITTKQANKLSEEEKKNLMEALGSAGSATPENMEMRYFFHLKTNETSEAIFNIDAEDKPVFKQYIDGEWVELEYTSNGDGTVTVQQVQNAPMAIFFERPDVDQVDQK